LNGRFLIGVDESIVSYVDKQTEIMQKISTYDRSGYIGYLESPSVESFEAEVEM